MRQARSTMNLFTALLVVAAVSGSACATQAEPQRDSAVTTDPPPTTSAMPHGDHRPHHGGLVLMNGNLHFEVVATREGRYRVYFSDEVRRELPASTASEVVLTVSRPHAAPEPIILSVDDEGESWVGQGKPFGNIDVTIRVAFVFEDKPYFIDIPWTPPAPAGTVMTSTSSIPHLCS